MDRRQLLVGGVAVASLLPMTGAVSAQATIEEDKVPALVGGAFARQSSELAVEKATNESVRVFAGLEAAEQAAVAEAFGAAGAEIPLREDHAAMMEALTAAEGAEFDVMYVDGQIAGHEELRGIHATYAESGTDPMARGASMVGVPSIDTHLVLLRGIRTQLV